MENMCSVLETAKKRNELWSYGIEAEDLVYQERKKVLNYLQSNYSCADNDKLACGMSRNTGNCILPYVTSTPNNLQITLFTNGALTRIDAKNLQATGTVTLSYDNPESVSFITSSLALSILYQGDLGVITTQNIIAFSRIGLTNVWNTTILITSTVNLGLGNYNFLATFQVTDSLTTAGININISNTI